MCYSEEILDCVKHFGISEASRRYNIDYSKLQVYCKNNGIKKVSYNDASNLPEAAFDFIKTKCTEQTMFLNSIQSEVLDKFNIKITNIDKVVDEIFEPRYSKQYKHRGVLRKCKICGNEFYAASPKQQICKNDHVFKCRVCGKSVTLGYKESCYRASSNHLFYCSKECEHKALTASKHDLKYTCICRLCGKAFKSNVSFATVCSDQHYGTCVVCGKKFELNYPYTRKTCSQKCRAELASRTTENKFGYKTILATPEIQEKSREAIEEKYGTKNYFNSNDWAKRYHEMLSNPNSMNKINEKKIHTYRKHYGVDWGLQSTEVKEKSKKTLIAKYGVDNVSKSAHFYKLQNTESSPEQVNNLIQFKSDPNSYLSNLSEKPTLRDLSKQFGIRDSSVGYLIDQLGIDKDKIEYVYSYMEDEVYDFLLKLNLNTEIIRNTFKVITPYELDIYIPNYKFAIECDPTSTHNSSFGAWSVSDDPLPRSYHKLKTDLCESKGIRLFHIFGYDWSNNKSIIFSMIENALGNTPNKIYARKTDIRPVSYSDSARFLQENHRQGNTVNSIRIGLYYKNELVSLMTFGKMRKTIGKSDNENTYELSRFCSKINTSVIGGASKLFEFFVNEYNPESIISFSDRAHTSGNLYETLGFKEIRRSDPGYVWVCLKDDKAWSRVNAQKKNIVKFLKDPSIDLTKSEFEIMEAHKYAAVFDSGTITWQWRR